MTMNVWSRSGWIGFDLDGTLAQYNGWKGSDHIGKPISLMVEKAKSWMAKGYEVKIMTARAADLECIPNIKQWCKIHLGIELEVVDRKDFLMLFLYDDRAIQVEKNTGVILGDESKVGI